MQERRHHVRYLYPQQPADFEVTIVWASAPEYSPSDIEIIDISRAGLGIISNNVFGIGDTVKLDVKLGDTSMPTMVAVVCNRRVFDNNPVESAVLRGQLFRYGLYFEMDGDQQDPKLATMLDQLETMIKRHQQA